MNLNFIVISNATFICCLVLGRWRTVVLSKELCFAENSFLLQQEMRLMRAVFAGRTTQSYENRLQRRGDENSWLIPLGFT